MKKLLTDILNVVFPPRETDKLVQTCTDSKILNYYRPANYKEVIYLANYQNPTIRALIVENKYQQNIRAAKLLRVLVKNWLADREAVTLFVPIPLGPNRLKERGYNQVESILNKTEELIQANLLIRVVDTRPQTELSKAERDKNIKGAFAYTDTNLDWSNYKQIVLIDDVVTTSATLKEARASLAPHLPQHIQLLCLAIAH